MRWNAIALAGLLALPTMAACDGDKAQQTPDKMETGDATAKKAAEKPTPKVGPAALPDDMKTGLLVAISQFAVGEDKKVQVDKPGAARLEIVTREGGKWRTQVVEDPTSNVFHKAFVYSPPGGEPGIVTLGGMGASVKIWRKKDGKFVSETLWEKDFGGKVNRMRDAEIGDLYGDGVPTMGVATHNQGVVATIKPVEGKYEVKELSRTKDTFVHEIEIGDLNGDKVLEIYATPSEPNRMDGSVQSGHVTRYIPKEGGEPVVVADLGDRHAKEILVADIDGDGKDELYVAVEAKTEKVGGQSRVKSPVEIRRYDADTDPKAGVVVATIKDRLCRFLTAGDVDGDGKKELIAAPFSAGLQLMRPGADPAAKWETTLIDKKSSGFEHAAILLDLDGDNKDELYVASDRQGELRRYVWNGTGFDKSVISTREVPRSIFTWNLMPVPVDLVK